MFSPDTKDYLDRFRVKWPDREIHRMVEVLDTLNVLVVGDAIIDQYHYVSPLGQTGKGNVLAVQYDTEEQFAGGSMAVANHIARFAKSVTLVAGLGDTQSHEEFIREKLHQNITPIFRISRMRRRSPKDGLSTVISQNSSRCTFSMTSRCWRIPERTFTSG